MMVCSPIPTGSVYPIRWDKSLGSQDLKEKISRLDKVRENHITNVTDPRSRGTMNAWKTLVADSRANQWWDHPRPVGTWTFSARRTKSLNFSLFNKYKKRKELRSPEISRETVDIERNPEIERFAFEISRSKTIRFASQASR